VTPAPGADGSETSCVVAGLTERPCARQGAASANSQKGEEDVEEEAEAAAAGGAVTAVEEAAAQPSLEAFELATSIKTATIN
jgi:hypothetical protein